MSPTKASFEPAFSDAEREELGHLHYLDARLNELRERGLIAPDGFRDCRRRDPRAAAGDRAFGERSQRHQPGQSTRQERPARCPQMGRVRARAGSITRRGVEPRRHAQVGPRRP